MFEITRATAQAFVTPEANAEAFAARQAYLDRGYVPCSIRGCTRLASPNFIRLLPGIDEPVALCPDVRRHQTLIGSVSWVPDVATDVGA